MGNKESIKEMKDLIKRVKNAFSIHSGISQLNGHADFEILHESKLKIYDTVMDLATSLGVDAGQIRKGDKVKMRKSYMNKLLNNDSAEHIKEFGECEGTVVGFCNKNLYDFVDVKWEPSNLRYGYPIDGLEIIRKINKKFYNV